MNPNELQHTLASLHEELKQADQVDDETRTMLTTLAQDIQRLAEQDDLPPSDAVEPLSARLQDMVLKFESDHPQLTGVLNRVSEALANMGI